MSPIPAVRTIETAPRTEKDLKWACERLAIDRGGRMRQSRRRRGSWPDDAPRRVQDANHAQLEAQCGS